MRDAKQWTLLMTISARDDDCRNDRRKRRYNADHPSRTWTAAPYRKGKYQNCIQ